jgi:hypothetical protein
VTTLTRLLNADGEVVGYFSDHLAEMAARREWDKHYGNSFDYATQTMRCRSIATDITSLPLEDVEPGDGDRVDYLLESPDEEAWELRVHWWHARGAASVEVTRHLINRYRRPGQSHRDADLGGPAEAAGVLYVLRIKAPK